MRIMNASIMSDPPVLRDMATLLLATLSSVLISNGSEVVANRIEHLKVSGSNELNHCRIICVGDKQVLYEVKASSPCNVLSALREKLVNRVTLNNLAVVQAIVEKDDDREGHICS